MIRQLLALLLLTGCRPAPHSGGDPAPVPSSLSAVITAESAVFVVPTPPRMWSRVRSISDTADADTRVLNWHVSWDSVRMVGWAFGCCGIGVTVHVPKPAPTSIGDLLPSATRVSFTTEPAGSEEAIVLVNEPSIDVNAGQGAIVIRLGASASLSQLRRLRPDSLQVASHLWAADTSFVTWVKPQYLP
jgi:hypothetical protein